MTEPVLGPHKDRVKTDVWLSPLVVDAIRDWREALGVPGNAVVTLALLHFTVAHSAFMGNTPKRRALVRTMRTEFLRICEEVEKRG